MKSQIAIPSQRSLYWANALSTTARFGKYLGGFGGALTGYQVYDEKMNDRWGAHTFANVIVTGGLTIGAGSALAAGATTLAAGLTIGSFAYGVASAVGFDDEIDAYWIKNGRPLQERLMKRIHRLK